MKKFKSITSDVNKRQATPNKQEQPFKKHDSNERSSKLEETVFIPFPPPRR